MLEQSAALQLSTDLPLHAHSERLWAKGHGKCQSCCGFGMHSSPLAAHMNTQKLWLMQHSLRLSSLPGDKVAQDSLLKAKVRLRRAGPMARGTHVMFDNLRLMLPDSFPMRRGGERRRKQYGMRRERSGEEKREGHKQRIKRSTKEVATGEALH